MERFKQQMVKRMLGPPGVSACALAKTVGVPQPTLSRWLRAAGTLSPMPSDEKIEKPPVPKKWTVKEKLRVVAEAEGREGTALGELLRREGLHETELKAWREAAAGALAGGDGGSSGPISAKQRRQLAGAQKRVKELERELRRKEKALAEAAALLMLEKKLQALGWDERHHRGVRAALLEGGPTLAGAFLAAGLIDKIVGYVAPKLLGAGPTALLDAGVSTIADAIDLEITDVTRVGPDLRITALPRKREG